MTRRVIFFACLYSGFMSHSQAIRIKLDNCKLDPATLKEIQNSLNFQLGFYAAIFNDKTASTFSARVFGTQKEFQKYSKSKADFNPLREQAIAFYSNSLNEMILHTEVSDFTGTFSHELSHSILNYYCQQKQRTWMDEGLAELLEDVILSDSTYIFDSRQINKVRAAESLFRDDVSIVHAINSLDFYKSPNDRNYTLAWAVVMYLYCTDTKVLDKMISSDCQNAVDTIDHTYPGGLSVLENDVRSFFLNNKPKPN